jgi:hypothetical protein
MGLAWPLPAFGPEEKNAEPPAGASAFPDHAHGLPHPELACPTPALRPGGVLGRRRRSNGAEELALSLAGVRPRRQGDFPPDGYFSIGARTMFPHSVQEPS